MGMERAGQADVLAGEWQSQATGKLTVFLGAAPGVGKTYAMLSRARELQRQGVDIVVGFVETHGRSETHAKLEGLPVMPRRTLEHQGRLREELDLDGLLARHPAVALVDELAHRNAPGSRHERRWQDVEELLNAGIDVYSTVNVQHLESLNDMVHQITGVRVSETVPDAIFERLRDIRLVDLPARELIERFKQGKVYLPEQAGQALQAFFSPSNLTALRELAMQTVVDYVDNDLREARAARGLADVALQRHVLIAIDGLGHSEYLVRAGARIAERRGAPWSVVTVDTGRSADATLQRDALDRPATRRNRTAHAEQQRQMELNRAFALARSLGGGTEVLHSSDIAQALLDAAAARGARSIIIGRTRERPIARIFNRTLTQQLLLRGERYELTIVSTPQARKGGLHWPDSTGEYLAHREPGVILAATVGATVMAALAERLLGLQDLAMVFLVAVMLVASRTRMVAAVITAVLCFIAYDWLFMAPRFTLRISGQQAVTTMLLFLAVALIAGRLASRLRMQVVALRAANSHAAAMQHLGRQLSKAADLGQVIAAGATVLHATFQADTWVRINGESSRAVPERFDDKDGVAAAWTEQHGLASGRYTDTLINSAWWFLPVRQDRLTLGVVGLRFPAGMSRLSFEQRRLAESMVDDIGQAAVRARLVAELESARVTGETERLRSALLASVSHDLRSPLSAMIGAADSLQSYGKDMGQEDRDSLLEMIRVEGERLDRYIQNLLDMTRLGHQGGLSLKRDWIGLDELVGAAAMRLQRYQPGITIQPDIPVGLAPIHVHPALIEQAIFNVLENAAKFSPPGEAVRVEVRPAEEDQIRLDISDRGPGMPESERLRIFDMFYSVARGDRGKHGTGLGLTIVQGIVGAHMGSVEALPGPDGKGTTIRILLPWQEQPEF